jgi:hypothetical protein
LLLQVNIFEVRTDLPHPRIIYCILSRVISSKSTPQKKVSLINTICQSRSQSPRYQSPFSLLILPVFEYKGASQHVADHPAHVFGQVPQTACAGSAGYELRGPHRQELEGHQHAVEQARLSWGQRFISRDGVNHIYTGLVDWVANNAVQVV